jgi:hypothetical protein
VLAFGVLAVLWLIVLLPSNDEKRREQVSLVFIYLQFLMVLIIGHFFTAHGHTIGGQVSVRSPLGLPAGSVRFLLLAGYLGLTIYLYRTQFEFKFPETGPIVIWLLVMVSAYFLGHLVNRVMHGIFGEVFPPWFQDIEAWVAIMSLLVLTVVLMVRLVINPSAPPETQINLDYTEAVLAGLVGFYFGSRS